MQGDAWEVCKAIVMEIDAIAMWRQCLGVYYNTDLAWYGMKACYTLAA